MPDHFKAMVREPDLFMELDGFLESFWSDSLTDFEKQAWAQFLVDAEPGFQRLIEGTEKPYCWPPENKEDIRDEHNALSADNDELLWERGPSAEALRNVRFLAQLMTIRARWRCCYGEIADGFADLMTVYRLSGHFSGQRFVGEQLLGVGIQRFASTAMLDVLSRLDVSQEVLTEASNELALFLNRFVYAISFEAERFVMLDFVQRTFTDRDKGRGRPLKDGIPLTILTKSDYWKSLLLTGFRSRQSVVRDIDQLFDLLQEISRFGSEPNVYGVLVNAEIEEIYDKSILLSILGPPWQKSIEVVWMNRMLSQGVYTIMALERYHAAHGEYPESLEALLAAGYITTLPRDFYADGSLKYRRANDSFTLYSIGPNVRDDGGWQNPVSEWGYDREGGDRVFWPLP